MKKAPKKVADVSFDEKTLSVSLIEPQTNAEDWDARDLKTRSAYFALNGTPIFSVNEKGNTRFGLLTSERDFHAVKLLGITEVSVRIYHFSEKRAVAFSTVEKLKNENLGVMEEAYLIRKLMQSYNYTQNDVADMLGKSRPCIANTMRLLTLAPEVIGLIESGKLSAGHARTLVKVPKEKQFAFAQEAIKRRFSVREMERTVKAFLTPPEVLRREKEQRDAERSEALKTFVEQMRTVFATKVSLIGNDKKGRIYIDYYSPDDLLRIQKVLGIAKEEVQISFFDNEEE